MGFFKKKSEPEDNNRKALFGNKTVPKAPAANNPYAQQGQDDPYTTTQPLTGAQASYQHYQNVSYNGGLPGGPRAGAGGLPSGPRGGAPPGRTASTASNETAPPPYNGGAQQAPGGYGADRYGASSGYGSSRYNNSGYGEDRKQRSGGYGGLGPANDEVDQARDNLFDGAKERYEQRQQQPGDSNGGGSGYGDSSASGAGGDSAYGGYGERRELTAEEQEEEEVQAVRRQIKQTKLASANSAENSARIALATLEQAEATYARLGAQGDRLNYTEGLLDKAGLSTKEANDQTKELKSLNGSMFKPTMKNPLTRKKREAEWENKIASDSAREREDKARTAANRFQANSRVVKGFGEIEGTKATEANKGWHRPSAAEKNKYEFSDDEEDEEAEERIDNAMRDTSRAVKGLLTAATLMSKEIDSQDHLIGRLGEKSDSVNDQARLNTERLRRIR